MLRKLYNFLFRRGSSEHYWKLRTNAINTKSVVRRYYSLFFLHRYHAKFNASIPLTAHIASRPSFPHGLNGIFISSGAEIGKNCVIFHQVTIGSNALEDSNFGAPRIGDNVYIGVGAKIIGNVCIGNNVRIGANCVVVKDVPDDSTVVLQAPRIINHTEKKDNTFHPYAAKS